MSTSPAPDRERGHHLERRRSQARERALDLLYEAEVKSVEPSAVIAELPVAPDEYACRLAGGVEARRREIDALLAEHASGWALDRMPAVDRQVLRLATYELLAEPEVPPAVVIDEAVELAKQFSTEDSGRFVNGVLAAIARRIGRLPAGTGADSGDPGGDPGGAAGTVAPEPAPDGENGGAAGRAGTPAPAPAAERQRPGAIGSVRAAPLR